MKRGPMLVAALNSILPPNQISLRIGGGEDGPLAKCSVVTLSTLVRETSERRKDHFCAGRLFQPTEVLFTRSGKVADEVLGALASAHAVTFSWVRPWLPPVFGVETYCRSLLRVSLGREIRPEPASRSEALWEAQRGYLTETYSLLLQDLVGKGELEPRGPASTPWHARCPWRSACGSSSTSGDRRFAPLLAGSSTWSPSTTGSTTSSGRHSATRGREIVLGRWERALPIVFLWPRLLRYLRGRNR